MPRTKTEAPTPPKTNARLTKELMQERPSQRVLSISFLALRPPNTTEVRHILNSHTLAVGRGLEEAFDEAEVGDALVREVFDVAAYWGRRV